jgi:hypothetical protein
LPTTLTCLFELFEQYAADFPANTP